ncbi:hypothetical protein [Neodiprion abietis nucleopolyhedrovirus]|uniref:Uncharacterized protein n=1 Tax=Neodiprion abietis nucleopolyhedrovirus TaxID=204507 RepID=Q0ZP34_9CBAC|nr:hypothetical protein [Neodiprion abietis nucleopolyhedrovirus]ABC74920.1 unknown [Neodiprion abietis nucleopolyhedrovirus]
MKFVVFVSLSLVALSVDESVVSLVAKFFVAVVSGMLTFKGYVFTDTSSLILV